MVQYSTYHSRNEDARSYPSRPLNHGVGNGRNYHLRLFSRRRSEGTEKDVTANEAHLQICVRSARVSKLRANPLDVKFARNAGVGIHDIHTSPGREAGITRESRLWDGCTQDQSVTRLVEMPNARFAQHDFK